MTLTAARRVADSVLYEGYVLFPYRASARKNRFRWQFGIVAPPGAPVTEPDALTTACLVTGPAARLSVTARFLQLDRRDVWECRGGDVTPVDRLQVGERLVTAWDEGIEREVTTGELDVGALLEHPHTRPFTCEGGGRTEDLAHRGRPVGRVAHRRHAVRGDIRVSAEVLPSGRVRLLATVANSGAALPAGTDRDEVLRHSLVGAHLLLTVRDAAFISLIDPPPDAAGDAASCSNRQLYPVLVGEPGSADVVLAAPIILYDHPQIAPESGGETYDATEIDELLSLTVTALTDEEKREARATDPRAAQIIDRADAMPPELLDRLHGAVRSLKPAPQPAPVVAPIDAFADFFGADEPPRQRLDIDGRTVRIGDTVRLCPSRRADAQDLFTAGRRAYVRRIADDVDGTTWIGVSLVDDPGAHLHGAHTRYLYFHPDEIEPLDAGVDTAASTGAADGSGEAQ